MREQLRKMNTESIKEAVSEQGALIGSTPIPGGMTITEAVALALAEEGGIYRKRVGKVLTIPSGQTDIQSVEVDLTDEIPEEATNITVKLVSAGNYPMPYISDAGNIVTWMSTITSDHKKVTIRNKATAWTNYTFYFDIEYTS